MGESRWKQEELTLAAPKLAQGPPGARGCTHSLAYGYSAKRCRPGSSGIPPAHSYATSAVLLRRMTTSACSHSSSPNPEVRQWEAVAPLLLLSVSEALESSRGLPPPVRYCLLVAVTGRLERVGRTGSRVSLPRSAKVLA